jgi:hypothetical protein
MQHSRMPLCIVAEQAQVLARLSKGGAHPVAAPFVFHRPKILVPTRATYVRQEHAQIEALLIDCEAKRAMSLNNTARWLIGSQ